MMLGVVALLVDLSVIPLTQGWGSVWLAFVLVALVGSSIQ
jgi:hypothetical protein